MNGIDKHPRKVVRGTGIERLAHRIWLSAPPRHFRALLPSYRLTVPPGVFSPVHEVHSYCTLLVNRRHLLRTVDRYDPS